MHVRFLFLIAYIFVRCVGILANARAAFNTLCFSSPFHLVVVAVVVLVGYSSMAMFA